VNSSSACFITASGTIVNPDISRQSSSTSVSSNCFRISAAASGPMQMRKTASFCWRESFV